MAPFRVTVYHFVSIRAYGLNAALPDGRTGGFDCLGFQEELTFPLRERQVWRADGVRGG